MLGLRFFACDQCDTISAAVEEPAQCGRCGDRPLAEITRRLDGGASYFAPVTKGDR